MHVAIVTETWPPEINGVALTAQSLGLGLARLGNAVEIVRPQQEATLDVADDDLTHTVLPGAAVPRYPGLRFGLPARRTLVRRWTRTRPDAIYIATEGPLGASALSAARDLGIAACTGFHTRFDDFARHYGFGWLTPAVFAYLRRFHNRAAATLVPTTQLASYLAENGFRDVRVLHRAVDTAQFDPDHRDEALRRQWGLAAGQLAVIHVGRIAAEKNIDLAIRAFRSVADRHDGTRMIVVGDGPARGVLAQNHPDIVFTGMLRGADLARHYASADLFLFPSVTETFGNVTLEALSSGVPVIAFDYGAAHEYLRESAAGIRVAFGDDDAFVRAAVSFADRLDAVAERDRARLAARRCVEALSPDSVARHFAELLGELARQRVAA